MHSLQSTLKSSHWSPANADKGYSDFTARLRQPRGIVPNPPALQELIEQVLGFAIVGNDRNLARHLAQRCDITAYEAGAGLIEERQRDSDLFLILAGSVAILSGGREIARRNAGEHVGEMALVDPGSPRSASAIALERTIAARISEPDFSALAQAYPVLWRRIASNLGKRIQQFHDHEASLEFAAHHDALTLLPNRALFAKRWEHAVEHAQHGNHASAVLYVDLDGFKPINDTHGHAIGDQILKLVGSRLLHCVRGTDTVARFGGDEFVVLLSSIGARADAALVASKLVDNLNQPFAVDGIKLSLSASVGIALYPDHGSDLDTLTRQADAALYNAKRGGRNTFRVFNDSVSHADRTGF